MILGAFHWIFEIVFKARWDGVVWALVQRHLGVGQFAITGCFFIFRGEMFLTRIWKRGGYISKSAFVQSIRKGNGKWEILL
jgi:hypothetical protein